MKYLLLFGFLLSFGQNLLAQDEAQKQQVQKAFLILNPGLDFSYAMQHEWPAVKSLQPHLHSRNLRLHPKLVTCRSRKKSEDNFGAYPFSLSWDDYHVGPSLCVAYSPAFLALRSLDSLLAATAFPKGDPAPMPFLRIAHKESPDACPDILPV